VSQDVITWDDARYGPSNIGDRAGTLDAQRHRWMHADVPAASADDLVPVTDAGGPNRDQDFICRQWTRLGQLDHANLPAYQLHARATHPVRILLAPIVGLSPRLDIRHPTQRVATTPSANA
jgi:hypothetical protein